MWTVNHNVLARKNHVTVSWPGSSNPATSICPGTGAENRITVNWHSSSSGHVTAIREQHRDTVNRSGTGTCAMETELMCTATRVWQVGAALRPGDLWTTNTRMVTESDESAGHTTRPVVNAESPCTGAMGQGV